MLFAFTQFTMLSLFPALVATNVFALATGKDRLSAFPIMPAHTSSAEERAFLMLLTAVNPTAWQSITTGQGRGKSVGNRFHNHVRSHAAMMVSPENSLGEEHRALTVPRRVAIASSLFALSSLIPSLQAQPATAEASTTFDPLGCSLKLTSSVSILNQAVNYMEAKSWVGASQAAAQPLMKDYELIKTLIGCSKEYNDGTNFNKWRADSGAGTILDNVKLLQDSLDQVLDLPKGEERDAQKEQALSYGQKAYTSAKNFYDNIQKTTDLQSELATLRANIAKKVEEKKVEEKKAGEKKES